MCVCVSVYSVQCVFVVYCDVVCETYIPGEFQGFFSHWIRPHDLAIHLSCCHSDLPPVCLGAMLT